jgi:hypothetical protein
MNVTVPIPSWNAEGLIPAADAADPTSANRAPYPVSLTDFVLRFSTSDERRAILAGFLDYRAALHGLGMVAGFQWVDGSFAEHIEIGIRKRAPKDVDVVNFCSRPSGRSEADLIGQAPELFPDTYDDQQALKSRFKVDGYIIMLSDSPEDLVGQSAYWYGLWSHQRDTFKWKGFLQLDLDPAEDTAARLLLIAPTPGGTT